MNRIEAASKIKNAVSPPQLRKRAISREAVKATNAVTNHPVMTERTPEIR